MKTLKILLEELSPRIYHNIHPNTLLNLSKEHGTTRFIIKKTSGQIHAGNAHDFIHTDLGYNDEDIPCAITHHNGKYTYAAFGKHPALDYLEKKGVEKGEFQGDWSNLRIVPKVNTDDIMAQVKAIKAAKGER